MLNGFITPSDPPLPEKTPADRALVCTHASLLKLELLVLTPARKYGTFSQEKNFVRSFLELSQIDYFVDTLKTFSRNRSFELFYKRAKKVPF